MTKLLISILLAAAAAFGQYKVEPAGPAPAELSSAIRQAMQKDGIKVLGAGGAVVCELWFRTTSPGGPKSTEQDVTLPAMPQGALLGAIRFTAKGSDRRGQSIKPGVYTLRYAVQPMNGDHQGVAPQRDFALAVPAANDKSLDAISGFDDLVKASEMASGTPHPAVFSIWKDDQPSSAPSIAKQGDSDWAVHVKVGDLPVAMIVVGAYQG
jgi:hypothetical protein